MLENYDLERSNKLYCKTIQAIYIYDRLSTASKKFRCENGCIWLVPQYQINTQHYQNSMTRATISGVKQMHIIKHNFPTCKRERMFTSKGGIFHFGEGFSISGQIFCFRLRKQC